MPHPESFVPRLAQLLVATVMFAMASALYIDARLGTGPRDSVMMGLSDRFRVSVRATRSSIEIAVLIVGYLLGGPVGIGTVLYALLVGPLVQTFLRLFRGVVRAPPDAAQRRAERPSVRADRRTQPRRTRT